MGIILCIFIIMYIWIVLYIRNFDVLSPSFLSGMVFLLSVIAFLVRSNAWGIRLSFTTVFFIMSCLYTLFLGEILFLYKSKKGKPINLYYLQVNKKIIYMEVIMGFIVSFVYWRFIQTIAQSSSSDSGNVLWDARISMLEGTASSSTFINICKTVVIMFSIFCICIYLNNRAFNKATGKKINQNYMLFPVIPTVIVIILDTGRTEFVRLLSVTFVAYIFYSNYLKKKNQKSIIKLIKQGVIFLSILLIIFWLVGSISNKNGSYTMINSVAKYIGSGIGALNEVLVSNKNIELTWGENTFRGLIQTLAIFFPTIQPSSNVLSFVTFENGEMTNIYTAFFEYYCDFGYIGALIIYFIMGFFLSWLYQKAKYNGSSIWSILFVFYYYAIFRQITAADFLSTYFGLTHIIAFLTFSCSFVFLTKKQKTY